MSNWYGVCDLSTVEKETRLYSPSLLSDLPAKFIPSGTNSAVHLQILERLIQGLTVSQTWETDGVSLSPNALGRCV